MCPESTAMSAIALAETSTFYATILLVSSISNYFCILSIFIYLFIHLFFVHYVFTHLFIYLFIFVFIVLQCFLRKILDLCESWSKKSLNFNECMNINDFKTILWNSIVNNLRKTGTCEQLH